MLMLISFNWIGLLLLLIKQINLLGGRTRQSLYLFEIVSVGKFLLVNECYEKEENTDGKVQYSRQLLHGTNLFEQIFILFF